MHSPPSPAPEAVEASAVSGFGPEQVQTLRRMLFTIIGSTEDRGSCL